MTKSEQDSIKQYRIIGIVILIAFFLIIVSVVGWKHCGYFNENTINIVTNDGDLIINYVDGNQVNFNSKKNQSYIVSVTNNGSEKLFFSLELDDVYANNEVNVIVKTESGDEVYNETDINSDVTLFSLYSINAGETLRYTVNFIPSKKTEFTGMLSIINESLTTQTFSDLILLNNDIGIAKTKVGSEVSEGDEGLLTSNDNDGISYYFRGGVRNNYVVINDLTFRIVRINGDGTVRLVLDNTIANKAPYNTNSVNEGEEASSAALLENASILEVLNNWYNDALGDYNSIISNGKFCSESSFTNLNGGLYRSDTYNRLYFNMIPSLQCSGTEYSGKVGLLSADEVTMAGSYQSHDNNNYYLYNENIKDIVILSSSDYLNSNDEVVMFGINPDGGLNDSVLASDSVSIRPVINLGMDAKVKGKGTKDNPYIIVS